MIIIQVAGGLGNQLNQYALYRKFLSIGKEARLDLSWFYEPKGEEEKSNTTNRNLELEYFDGLLYETCTKEQKKSLIGPEGLPGKVKRKLMPWAVFWFHESKMFHPELFEFEDMYLSGYFACEKYYVDILPELRKEIQFPLSSDPSNEAMAQEMRNCSSVSIHLRRGDYLNAENRAMFGNICTEEYYEKAIEVIKSEVEAAHFYIFSDDIPYVRQKYQGEEYTVVDINHGKNSFYDMWLMSNCKHNICANSTFSFWGARLNGNDQKILVRPTIHKNTQTFKKEEMEKLWQGWRFVSPEGKLQ